eukprot:CAMPEP_0172490410 /NCGR_PEP_ID=MMETSP1066-20121228/20817_1 /TAXON_ID=671091 /ORGANISM="Coscinodiscus wailesii, Strain CCMP2513" /LENGTH=732 /DNA_ID=CAMNT_0013258863 /DNA_START=18 /DNA_END=2216 /DNA_ORIENTATION=+
MPPSKVPNRNNSARGGKRKVKKKKESVASSNQIPIDDDDIYQEPLKRFVTPENQVKLTEEQLKEDIARVLTGDDPNVPKGVSKFSFKDRCYKPDPPGLSDHMAIHFVLKGSTLHVESEEYRLQKEREEAKAEEDAEYRKAMMENSDGGGGGNDGGGDLPEEELSQQQQQQQQGGDGGGGSGGASVAGDGHDKKNQFNYSERASQTFTNPPKSRGVSTEPPPVTQYSASITQWDIYDTYMSDHVLKMIEQQRESGGDKGSAGGGNGTNPGSSSGTSLGFEDRLAVLVDDDDDGRRDKDAVHSVKMAASLKIMERLVNQNAQDEIFQDFKYWEDASDPYREGEGSLLPLWRFSTDRSKRKQVTALCWNPRYTDLFAVGYGSYDFMRQGSGTICCFSLKNTSFPEFIFTTESGVTCLDFHPQHPSLLGVGCYDGTVMVYNLCNGGTKPIYTSSIKTGKHTDPVWQVHWQSEDLAKELNFYSISSDGRVANWSMSKNELKMEPVMQLKLVNAVKDEHHPPEQETTLTGLAGGCCFDFNLRQEHLFIVGTEEGNIHKCSKAYSGQYLETYEGHHMAVYSVKWNPFHERIFISCSEDWTVKIWDHNRINPIMSFDLGNAVGDVCWAPYSSTVFAAVTSDGKVHVFDLAENKHEALCEQKVVKRAKLTHARFNFEDFILIVGDDRGGVNSLKLSPNLRKLHLPVDKDGNVSSDAADREGVQYEKMKRLLAAIDAEPSSN